MASAAAMHVFARSVIGSTWGALVAGTIWGFWPYRMAHLEHLQLQALYAMPLAFLCLHRFVAGARRRDAAALGAAAAFQAATSVYYGVIGALGLAVAFIVLLTTTGGRRAWTLVRRGLLAALVGAVLVAPFVWPYWQVQEREGFTRNLYEAARHAAAPGDYLGVAPSNVIYGSTGWLVNDRGSEAALFPGLTAIVVALGGLVVARRRGLWPTAAAALALIVTGFVLSLGPDGIRPIYATLHRWVFGFQAIRAPARFAVLVAFGVATLAAIAVRGLEDRWRDAETPARGWPVACAALLVALAIEYASAPLRFIDAPPASTAVGRWLTTAGRGAVVHLPLSIDVENTPFMVDSLEHRLPVVNGYSGQRPAFFSGAVDALGSFPSAEAMWMLKDLDVRFVVTPAPVAPGTWPLTERARLSDPVRGERWIYELAWSPEVEARLGEPSTPVPPEPGPVPFAVGERLTYRVIWDGPAGIVDAGTVNLAVDPAPASDSAPGQTGGYRFSVEARTAPWIARFFEADDRFVTTTDPQLFPQVHERMLREGRRRVDQRIHFDAARLQAQPLTPAGEPAGPAVRLWPHVRDAVAAFYFVRTLNLAPGSRVEMPIVENGRHSTLEIEAAGAETRHVSGRDLATVRVHARLRQRVPRRKPSDITVWLERDAPRALVVAEVAAVFGNLRVELAARR